MKQSRFLQCPLAPRFFSKLGKVHRSEIRRAIHKAWGLDQRSLYPLLRQRLLSFGKLEVTERKTNHWQGAFRFADEWNQYEGVEQDQSQMQRELRQAKWDVGQGTLMVDMPTWLTLASLSFLRDMEKESPNHLFLKEVCKLFIHRRNQVKALKEEVYLDVYGEKVRCDILGEVDRVDTIDTTARVHCIVGEVGGVQLWKVLALLHKGYEVVVFPHWTTQKVNPFIRKKLSYDYYRFKPRREVQT